MFTNPLGLIALLAVPAVVALHLFRRRFRPRVVSALFLWEARDAVSLSGRRRQRLLRTPSFWCELLAALLLALACGGPRGGEDPAAGHLVVVLDGSASMGAVWGGRSARDRVASELEDTLRSLGGASRVTLVLSGPRPRILAGPAAFPSEALDALASYAPTAASHDLAPAVALALQLSAGGAVRLLSDRYLPEGFPPEVGLSAVGKPLENYALTRASRVRDAGGERVLLTVASFARGPGATVLVLSVDGVELSRTELTLEAGESRHLSFELPDDAPAVELALSPDALEIDDRAVLLPPPRRHLRLATTLPAEDCRLLGLAGPDSPIERWLELVPQSRAAASPEVADLVLATSPTGGPTTWCLVLESDASEPLDLIGPFLIEKRHPLLEGVTLEGVVWSTSSDRVPSGSPLVAAGNRPLLTEEREGERLIVRAGLVARRSSLQRSPDWPILLANLAELRRRGLPGPQQSNVVIGESFVFRGDGPAEYVLRGPTGERSLRAHGRLTLDDDVERVGLYELERDGSTLCRFSVNFADAAESDLSTLAAGRREPSVPPAPREAGSTGLQKLLILLAVVALLLDWLFLRGTRAGSGGGGAA